MGSPKEKIDLSGLSREGKIGFLDSANVRGTQYFIGKKEDFDSTRPFLIDKEDGGKLIEHCLNRGSLDLTFRIAYMTGLWNKKLASRLREKYWEKKDLDKVLEYSIALKDTWKVTDLMIQQNNLLSAIHYEASEDFKQYGNNHKWKNFGRLEDKIKLKIAETFLENPDRTLIKVTDEELCKDFIKIVEGFGFEKSAIALYKNANLQRVEGYFPKGIKLALKNGRDEDAKKIFSKFLSLRIIGDELWTKGSIRCMTENIGRDKTLELCIEDTTNPYHSGKIGGIIAEESAENCSINEMSELLKKAIKLYEKAGSFIDCLRISKKIEDTQKINLYQKIVNYQS